MVSSEKKNSPIFFPKYRDINTRIWKCLGPHHFWPWPTSPRSIRSEPEHPLTHGYPGSDIYSTWNVDNVGTKACGEITKHQKISVHISPINKYEERIFGTKNGLVQWAYVQKFLWGDTFRNFNWAILSRTIGKCGMKSSANIFFWGYV
jgi:hypothetical protein